VRQDDKEYVAIALIVFFVLFAIVGGSCYGIPRYNVWQKGLAGEAQLREAEWNRQITIREAEAKQQSAKALAQAEIERAKGVAEANRIIGESLQGNEAYLRYLWIQALMEDSNSVIYVPTEASLPILEAGKRQ